MKRKDVQQQARMCRADLRVVQFVSAQHPDAASMSAVQVVVREITNDVDRAYREYADAAEVARITTRRLVAPAEQRFQRTASRYHRGLASLQEYLAADASRRDAQRSSREAEIGAERARHHVAAAVGRWGPCATECGVSLTQGR